jgi:hypothetical protein
VFDARDIVGRVKRQAQNGVVLLKPHDFYIDARIRSSIFCYGTRPTRLGRLGRAEGEPEYDDLEKLAVKTGVALKTIRGFENERRKPLGVTRAAIKQALEQAGIEFLDGDGARMRK